MQSQWGCLLTRPCCGVLKNILQREYYCFQCGIDQCITKFFKSSPSQEIKRGIPACSSGTPVHSNYTEASSRSPQLVIAKCDDLATPHSSPAKQPSKNKGVPLFSPRRTRSRSVKLKSQVPPTPADKNTPNKSLTCTPPSQTSYPSHAGKSPSIIEAFQRANKKITGGLPKEPTPISLDTSEDDDVILLDPVESKNTLSNDTLEPHCNEDVCDVIVLQDGGKENIKQEGVEVLDDSVEILLTDETCERDLEMYGYNNYRHPASQQGYNTQQDWSPSSRYNPNLNAEGGFRGASKSPGLLGDRPGLLGDRPSLLGDRPRGRGPVAMRGMAAIPRSQFSPGNNYHDSRGQQVAAVQWVPRGQQYGNPRQPVVFNRNHLGGQPTLPPCQSKPGPRNNLRGRWDANNHTSPQQRHSCESNMNVMMSKDHELDEDGCSNAEQRRNVPSGQMQVHNDSPTKSRRPGKRRGRKSVVWVGGGSCDDSTELYRDSRTSSRNYSDSCPGDKGKSSKWNVKCADADNKNLNVKSKPEDDHMKGDSKSGRTFQIVRRAGAHTNDVKNSSNSSDMGKTNANSAEVGQTKSYNNKCNISECPDSYNADQTQVRGEAATDVSSSPNSDALVDSVSHKTDTGKKSPNMVEDQDKFVEPSSPVQTGLNHESNKSRSSLLLSPKAREDIHKMLLNSPKVKIRQPQHQIHVKGSVDAKLTNDHNSSFSGSELRGGDAVANESGDLSVDNVDTTFHSSSVSVSADESLCVTEASKARSASDLAIPRGGIRNKYAPVTEGVSGTSDLPRIQQDEQDVVLTEMEDLHVSPPEPSLSVPLQHLVSGNTGDSDEITYLSEQEAFKARESTGCLPKPFPNSPLSPHVSNTRFSQESFLGVEDAAVTSEESSDEDLQEMPSVLKLMKDLNEACSKPIPGTPTTELSMTEMPGSPEVECESSQPRSPSNLDDILDNQNGKFSLDNLLAERIKQGELKRETQEMEHQLKEGLKLGGITKYSEVTQDDTLDEDDLMPEHRQKLKELEVSEEVIQDSHPGEDIFNAAQFQQLFSYPATLTLSSCGFHPGKSFMEQLLTTLSPDMLLEFLASDTVVFCFEEMTCHEAFLSWLFLLMSVHRNDLVVNSSHRILYHLLHQKGNASQWVPSLRDITRIFLNYGGTLECLCPLTNVLSTVQCLLSTSDKEKLLVAPGELNRNIDRGYSRGNLQAVLKIITEYVSHKPYRYNVQDLTAITIMFFRVALDKDLNTGSLKFDFQSSFNAILGAFTENQWLEQMPHLCEMISRLTQHHHNRVYLVQLLPVTMRGMALQRRLAYTMLQRVLFPNNTVPLLITIPVKALFEVLATIQVKGNQDFYLTSSLIALVDLSVGNETLKASERDNLRHLIELLRSLMGDVREDISKLDRTRVKDMMVRLASKWTFMMQNMGTTQRSLFGYAHRQPALEEQPVKCSQNDESDNELDAEMETLDKEYGEAGESQPDSQPQGDS